MRFAVVLPWWGYVLAAGAALVLGWLAYTRVPVRVTLWQRIGLSAMRALTLLAIVVILLRPVVMVPPQAANNRLLPILIDVSRSMRLQDDAGNARIERAKQITRDLQAALSGEYHVETLTFGDTLSAATDIDRLSPVARRSDLTGAMADLAERYAGSSHGRLAGVIVLSDGGDTAPLEAPTPVGDRCAGDDRRHRQPGS